MTRIWMRCAAATCMLLTVVAPSTGTAAAQTAPQPPPLRLVDPKSPRGVTGQTDQFRDLDTPLGGRHYISDVIDGETRWQRWDGTPTQPVDVSGQTPQNFDSTHNHYQTLLVELSSVIPGANAIPIWGDSAANASGASAWGSFFSARSGCGSPPTQALPGAPPCTGDFDAQLTGLEVDVLNGGKPGVFGNRAKHGIQVVGFGQPNSHAMSVISHGFDRPAGEQDGQFEAVLYQQNALVPEYGRMIVSDQPRAMMGVDFRKTVFTRGAGLFRTDGLGTGLIFNEGRGGEIAAGARSSRERSDDWLTLRAGEGGVRFVSNDGRRELLAIDGEDGVSGRLSTGQFALVLVLALVVAVASGSATAVLAARRRGARSA